MTGAGYSLHWVVGEVHVEMHSESDVDLRSGSDTQCGCVSRLSGSQGEGTRRDALQDMAGRINRYVYSSHVVLLCLFILCEGFSCGQWN